MKARMIKAGWTDPATGKTPERGAIVDGSTARHALNDGAAEPWGPKERKAFASKVGAVIKEGLD